MIGILEEVQRCARAEPIRQPLEEPEVRELVAGPLQKQHRHVDLDKMLGARVRRLPSRMQRKAEEGEAAHARQRRFGSGRVKIADRGAYPQFLRLGVRCSR